MPLVDASLPRCLDDRREGADGSVDGWLRSIADTCPGGLAAVCSEVEPGVGTEEETSILDAFSDEF